MKKIYTLAFFILFAQSLIAGSDKFLLSKLVYDTIEKTQGFLDQNKYQDAKALLLSMDKSGKVRKKLDKAYIKFYIGYIYTLNEDGTKAIPYFKGALAFEALPPEQIQSIMLNLVQIYMQKSDYTNAINYLDQLIGSGAVKPEYYIYKANANLALKRYAAVIKNIDKAIALSKEKKPNWLKTKFYCYYVLADYSHAIITVKELIALEPHNKEYWVQLSSLYSVEKKSLDAASTLDVADALKINLNENELLQLVSWLQYMNVPYKAATIMQSGIQNKIIQASDKNLESLGDLYYEAKEFDKAIEFYLQVAQKSDNKKMYFKVSQIYSNMHNNKEVIKNIKLSLQGEDNTDTGEKKLLLAKAYYELGMIKESKEIFVEALKYPKSKKFASAWIAYLK